MYIFFYTVIVYFDFLKLNIYNLHSQIRQCAVGQIFLKHSIFLTFSKVFHNISLFGGRGDGTVNMVFWYSKESNNFRRVCFSKRILLWGVFKSHLEKIMWSFSNLYWSSPKAGTLLNLKSYGKILIQRKTFLKKLASKNRVWGGIIELLGSGILSVTESRFWDSDPLHFTRQIRIFWVRIKPWNAIRFKKFSQKLINCCLWLEDSRIEDTCWQNCTLEQENLFYNLTDPKPWLLDFVSSKGTCSTSYSRR